MGVGIEYGLDYFLFGTWCPIELLFYLLCLALGSDAGTDSDILDLNRLEVRHSIYNGKMHCPITLWTGLGGIFDQEIR